MVVDSGYMCKKCNKIYHQSKQNLPIYCKKCGADLVDEKYSYNLIRRYGKVVETRDTNFFGGYDCVKITLNDNAQRVKIKRKFLFWWELFNE